MNKKIMFLWGWIVVMLFAIILIIGYKQRDNVYINLTSSLKDATREYIKDKKMHLGFNQSTIVFIDDLLKDEYIEENKEIKDYCINSVVYTKGLFSENYEINQNCEKNE